MACVVSLFVGLVIGGAYALIGVKSPAPPTAALIGLLGMLTGEHLVALLLASKA